MKNVGLYFLVVKVEVTPVFLLMAELVNIALHGINARVTIATLIGINVNFMMVGDDDDENDDRQVICILHDIFWFCFYGCMMRMGFFFPLFIRFSTHSGYVK